MTTRSAILTESSEAVIDLYHRADIVLRPVPGGAVAPHEHQDRSDEDQSRGEPYPNSGDSPAVRKAQDVGDRQADEPIADEVGEHGGSGIAKTTEGAGRDGLNSVEE